MSRSRRYEKTPVVFCDVRFFLVKADHLSRQAQDTATEQPSNYTYSCNGRSDEVEATCTGNANELPAACTGEDDGTGTTCALNAASDACNVDGGDCAFAAATAPASCTGTDDGAGAACELNDAEDACNVLEDGNNCVFDAATTRVCDLDASTDGTAECLAGCDYTIAYTPVCDLDDSTAPVGTADCPAGCVEVAEEAEVLSEIPSSCTGTDDGTGTGCVLNGAEDACSVNGGNCDFVAATPNLDASKCAVDDHNPGQTSVPDTDLVCTDTAPCVFSWNEPDFPACVPRECGSPTQTVERTVTCIAEASCTGTATDDAVDCAGNFAAQTTKTADDCAAGCTYGAAERAQARVGGVLQPVTNSQCTDSEPASQYTCPAAPACTFALYPADWCGKPAPFCQTLPRLSRACLGKLQFSCHNSKEGCVLQEWSVG